MKLTWRDALSTLFVATGGAIVFAKLNEYSWWLIGSWRGATAALAAAGLAAIVVSTYGARESGTKRNWFDDVEIGAAVVAAGLAIFGMIVASEVVFYTLAALMGAMWLTAVVRHIVHSYSPEDTYVSAH